MSRGATGLKGEAGNPALGRPEKVLYKYLLLPLCKHIYIYEVARAPNLMKGIVREGKFSE